MPTETKTITRTFTLPEAVYKKFKEAVPERKMSSAIAELIEIFTSRRAYEKLSAMRWTSDKEAKVFEKKIAEANRADLKAIH
jgi:predicted CopG family antitoxin